MTPAGDEDDTPTSPTQTKKKKGMSEMSDDDFMTDPMSDEDADMEYGDDDDTGEEGKYHTPLLLRQVQQANIVVGRFFRRLQFLKYYLKDCIYFL